MSKLAVTASQLRVGDSFTVPGETIVHTITKMKRLSDGQVIFQTYEQKPLYRQYRLLGFMLDVELESVQK